MSGIEVGLNDYDFSLVEREINQRLSTLADSRRWFHGRGHCFSGFECLTIDYFRPVVVVTLFQQPEASWESALFTWLTHFIRQQAVATVSSVVCQRRYLPGAPSEIIMGDLPADVFAQRGSLQFALDIARQQNIGFFLDMEPGRQWLESIIASRAGQNTRVLNLFAYTCAFSVVAQSAGAERIVNVDMSRAALNRGRHNHQLNAQRTDNVIFLQENILKSWGRIKKHGPYGVIIIDPPSYQPGSFVASKDYQKVLRRIPQLGVGGADILCCVNSPELDEAFIAKGFLEEQVPCELVSRLPAQNDFPDADPQRQLKLLHYRYVPGSVE